MPVHDRTRVDAGLFHAFHQRWISAMCDALNNGGLPRDYFALPEQYVRGPIPAVLTPRLDPGESTPDHGAAALAVTSAPPQTWLVRSKETDVYLDKVNRITIRHRHGDVVAVVEIVSPGNKGSRAEFRAFVDKSVNLLDQGFHLLIIDLFPPGKRDPQGTARAIWNEMGEEPGELELDPVPEKMLALNHLTLDYQR